MSELVFSQYANVMIKLDKAKYDSLKEDQVFIAATPEAKLKYFSTEFQESVKALFKVGEAHVKSQTSFAVAIYNTIRIAGVTLDEGSRIIQQAFGKSFERSYMSKLCKAGQVLVDNKSAKSIGDINKLADISRLPLAEQKALFEQVDVASTPRKEINETVSARLGVEAKETSKAITKSTIVGFVKAIEKMVAAFPGDTSIGDAAQGLIEVLSERMNDLEAPVAPAFVEVKPTIAPSRVARKVAKGRELARQLPLMRQAR